MARHSEPERRYLAFHLCLGVSARREAVTGPEPDMVAMPLVNCSIRSCFGGFMSSIVKAMQNWNDDALAGMPGVGGRIARCAYGFSKACASAPDPACCRPRHLRFSQDEKSSR